MLNQQLTFTILFGINPLYPLQDKKSPFLSRCSLDVHDCRPLVTKNLHTVYALCEALCRQVFIVCDEYVLSHCLVTDSLTAGSFLDNFPIVKQIHPFCMERLRFPRGSLAVLLSRDLQEKQYHRWEKMIRETCNYIEWVCFQSQSQVREGYSKTNHSLSITGSLSFAQIGTVCLQCSWLIAETNSVPTADAKFHISKV